MFVENRFLDLHFRICCTEMASAFEYRVGCAVTDEPFQPIRKTVFNGFTEAHIFITFGWTHHDQV